MSKEIPQKLPSRLREIRKIVREEQLKLAQEQAEGRRILPRVNTSGKNVTVNL